MLFSGQTRLLAAGAFIAVTAIPATFIASDATLAATFTAEPAVLTAPSAPAFGDTASLQGDDDNGVTDDTAPAPQTAANDTIDAELECMAKVVVHEAGNQPRAGKLAVAQLIQNRMESGRFADTICGVVNQPGQFFKTASYNPRRDTDTWSSAVEVSREARARRTADIAPGAMFFRAAYAAPTGFFRTRTRVMTLGDHVFYR